MIIIVSGLPRSGTAMMMNMLKAGGIKILEDKTRKPDENNPKGYFEYEPAKKLPEGNISWLDEAEEKAVKVISFFLQHLPDKFEYKIIFMERNFDEILKSQKQTVMEKGQKTHPKEDKMMLEYYKSHVKQTKEWISLQSNFSVLYLSYNEMVKHPEQHLDSICEFLGNELNKDKMNKVIDEKLYRQRSKKK